MEIYHLIFQLERIGEVQKLKYGKYFNKHFNKHFNGIVKTIHTLSSMSHLLWLFLESFISLLSSFIFFIHAFLPIAMLNNKPNYELILSCLDLYK